MKIKLEITEKELEAILCGIAEWKAQNKRFKDRESVEIKKTLTRLENRLQKISTKA